MIPCNNLAMSVDAKPKRVTILKRDARETVLFFSQASWMVSKSDSVAKKVDLSWPSIDITGPRPVLLLVDDLLCRVGGASLRVRSSAR